MPRIAKHLRERAVGMLEAGASTEDVAAQVGSSVQAVRSLRRRFVQTGSTEDLPRSGRPRVTTPAQDCYILNQHLRSRFLTATATASVTPGTHTPRISAQTVRNRLAENNLRARRPYVGTVLTDRHRRDRLQWADRHIRNERYADCCVLQRDRFGGGGSVMVWAGISFGYRIQLDVIDGNLNAQKYRDRVLAPHVVPLLQNHGVISVFQQDNARPHVARDNIQFLRNNTIDFIDDWPSKCPDLNPIEHLWDNLDTRVRQRQNPPGNVNELRDALQEEWINIPQAQINNLIHSMRRRCQAVSNARGGHTRF